MIVDRSGVGPDDRVVEIGPGKGALTKRLCERVGSVTAVEIDRDLIRYLEEQFSHVSNLSLVQKDFLKLDLRELLPADSDGLILMGNIPYNLSAPILYKLIESAPLIRKATLMVQQEVADRILARPGTKSYGVLSVLVQYYAEPKRLLTIPPEAFYPKPKVHSSVVQLDFHQPHPRRSRNEPLFRQVVKGAFSSRRKMIKNALLNSAYLASHPDRITRALEEAGIDGRARAESLDIDAFIDLTASFDRLMDEQDP
jgi:16S rRNA (adenine1518-N6/adenine1519-N6)-dimethyltransferase